MIVYNNVPNGRPISNSYFKQCIYTVRESTHSSSIGVLTSLLTTSMTYGRAESGAHDIHSTTWEWPCNSALHSFVMLYIPNLWLSTRVWSHDVTWLNHGSPDHLNSNSIRTAHHRFHPVSVHCMSLYKTCSMGVADNTGWGYMICRTYPLAAS